jgi:hypothetical protein
MSDEREKKPKVLPLSVDEFNELQRLNLVSARVDYDVKLARHQLNFRRETQGCIREYVR